MRIHIDILLKKKRTAIGIVIYQATLARFDDFSVRQVLLQFLN
jgi:hypothetical protein